MKKLLGILSIFAAVAVAHADPGYVTVSNISAKVLPLAAISVAPDFATNTAYAQGAYVKTSEKQVYMCLVAGTSGATYPVGRSDVTNGTATFRFCSPRPRSGFVLSNASTNTMYYSFGSRAVWLKGGMLSANGGTVSMSGADTFQGEVHVISSGTSNDCVSFEWGN